MSSVKRRLSTPHGALRIHNDSKDNNKKTSKPRTHRKNHRVSFASNIAKVWTYDKNSLDRPKSVTPIGKIVPSRRSLGELDMTTNVGSIIHVRKGQKRSSMGMELTENVGKIVRARTNTNKIAPAQKDEEKTRKESVGMDLTQNIGKILTGAPKTRNSVGMEMTTNIGSILSVKGTEESLLDSSVMDLTGTISESDMLEESSLMDMTTNVGGVLSVRDDTNHDTTDVSLTMDLTGVVIPEDSCISWDASTMGNELGEEEDSMETDSILEDISVNIPNDTSVLVEGDDDNDEEEYTPSEEVLVNMDSAISHLLSQFIDAAVLQQRQWACDNLNDAVEQLSVEEKQVRGEVAALNQGELEPKHLEAIRGQTQATTEAVWTQWCTKLEKSTAVRLEENMNLLLTHIDNVERCTSACIKTKKALVEGGKGSVRKAQDVHTILAGLQLWQLSEECDDHIVFRLDPKRPLQPYALTLNLAPLDESNEIDEQEIVGAAFEPLGEPIRDTFSLGLIKTTACAAVLANTSSTAQLRQALEEISFRLGRVQHLLSEVSYLEKKFTLSRGYGDDALGAFVKVTFSNFSTGNKFSVTFSNLHFGYPCGDIEWTFKRKCGRVTQEDIANILSGVNKSGFGRLSKCCKALCNI